MTNTDHKTSSAKEKISLRLGFALICLLTWPLAWFPHSLGLPFGAFMGRLFFRLSARRRQIAVANIEMIKSHGTLPDDLIPENIARESFANFGRAAWETIVFFHRGLNHFLSFCQVEEGQEYLEEVLAQSRQSGRGIMMVTGHMGSWELMNQYLAHTFNYKMYAVGRNSGNLLADDLIRRLRTAAGNEYIPKDGGAMPMMAVLKKGALVGTLIDQAVIADGSGVPLPFLGREATTNLGPVRLAHRTGATLIMVLFRRQGSKNFVKILPPLPPHPEMNRDEAAIADARALNDRLSDHIVQYPDQWMWGHRRWKTRTGVHQNADSIT